MEQLNSRETLLEAVRGLRAELERVVDMVGEARAVEPGSFGSWSFKDVIAHLNGWRMLTAARLEAGLRHEEPVFPWPGHLDEEHDLDAINRWFYEDSKPKSLGEVLRDQRETFERVEAAIAAMPEEDLLGSRRFAWLYWTDESLGPAVVRGTLNHYHEEHEPDVRAWLSKW